MHQEQQNVFRIFKEQRFFCRQDMTLLRIWIKKEYKKQRIRRKTFEVSMRVTGIKWVEIGEML